MHVITGLLPIASLFFDSAAKKKLLAKHADFFEKNNLREINENEISEYKRIYFFIMTGGTEQLFLNLYKKRLKYYTDENIVLLAHPDGNSLPAALEILAHLENEGIKGEIVFLQNREPGTLQNLQQVQEKLEEVRKTLNSTKIGLVGKPSDWLIASSPEPELVQKIWGPEVIQITINELISEIEKSNPGEIKKISDELVQSAIEVTGPSEKDISNSADIYLALKTLIARYELDSVSLRCFDLVTELKTSGCFALAELNDENIIAACEGDLCSNIGMLWAFLLTGETPWMANPANINLERSRILLAHCTIARSLVNSYKLRTHFESGIGIGIQGNMAPGPVTLLRIGGKNLNKLWLAEGNLVNSKEEENLCRTQIEIELYNVNKLEELLSTPLGNHIVMIRGHWKNMFVQYWETFISPER